MIRPGFKTCVWHNSYNHVKIDICFTQNSRLVTTTIRKQYGLLCSMDFTSISLYKICGVRRFGCCHTFQSYQKQHSSLCLEQNTWETCSPLWILKLRILHKVLEASNHLIENMRFLKTNFWHQINLKKITVEIYNNKVISSSVGLQNFSKFI